MTDRPIKACIVHAERFAHVIAGKDAGSAADLLVRDILSASGFLPLKDFMERNARHLRPNCSVPVLIDKDATRLVWIGVEKETYRVGVGWLYMEGPVGVIEVHSLDLGYTARPPRLGFKVPLQHAAH